MGIRLDNAKALYMEAINDGNYVEAINSYAGDRYTQHSTPVKDGKAGFIEFFADFVERNPDRKIEVVRGFEDGQYVFLQALQTLNGGEVRYVTADIFDTDDQGRMIEHWDIIEEMAGANVSGHTQIDGPTEPTDLDKTEASKALVTRFLDDVLTNGNVESLTDYVSTKSYVQHNPDGTDGVEAIEALFSSLADKGQTVRYVVHNVVGCGSFVAALSKVSAAGTDLAIIDLFRVEGDRIVEHWDVKETVLPQDQWVNSGKF